MTLTKNKHGFSADAVAVMARFLQDVHKLPPVAAVALAREITLESYLWTRLPELYDVGLPVSGVPALFAGARGKAMIEGLAAFTAQYGGQRLYIPQRITPEHEFYQIAGSEASARIVALYGGKPAIVPTMEALLRLIRNTALIEDYRKGVSLNELSERYGLAYPFVCNMTRCVRNERQVRRRCAYHRAR